MLLVLTPPPSYHVPLSLQSHDIPDPPIPTFVRGNNPPTTNAYRRTERALRELGISPPRRTSSDCASWYASAVRRLEWDLECDQLVVQFVDGSEERWELDELETEPRSEEFVSEEQMDAVLEDWGDPEKRWKGKGLERGRPSLQKQLIALCEELRSAWEDVSMREGGGPDLSDERDQDLLMKLAGDASMQIPYTWTNASSLYHHFMDSSSDAEDDDRPSRCSKRSTIASKLVPQFHGQLRDRRRPTSRTTSAFPPSSFLLLSAPPYDVLSLLALLTRTRHALVDLFALVVIPALKERFPPTFALWATTNALGWCRRQAVREGADAAQLMIQLLEDDGSLDELDDSGSEGDNEIDDSEDEEVWEGGESAEERRERRKKKNM